MSQDSTLYKVIGNQGPQVGFELHYSDEARAKKVFADIMGTDPAASGEYRDDFGSILSIRRDQWKLIMFQDFQMALDGAFRFQRAQARAQRKHGLAAQREAEEDAAKVIVPAGPGIKLP